MFSAFNEVRHVVVRDVNANTTSSTEVIGVTTDLDGLMHYVQPDLSILELPTGNNIIGLALNGAQATDMSSDGYYQQWLNG